MGLTKYNIEKHESQVNSLVNESYLKTGLHAQIFHGSVRFINTNRRRCYNFPLHPTRSQISEFSRTSRKRLFRLFSRINLSLLGEPVFVTLTYHYGYKASPGVTKQHLNCFLQFLRDNYPSLSYVWRLELQRRGAPHYHFILFPPKSESVFYTPSFEQRLRKAWHKIADPGSESHLLYGFRLVPITSFKMCMCYLSKYCAKENKEPMIVGFGRRWSYSQNLPLDPLLNLELPPSIYYLFRRLCRRLYKKRKKISRSFLHLLQSRASTTLFIDRSVSFRLLNIAVDSYFDSEPSLIKKHMFVEYAVKPTDPAPF